MIGVADGGLNATILSIFGCSKSVAPTQYDSGNEGLWGDDFRKVSRLRLRPPICFKDDRKHDDRRVWESGMHTEVPEF